MTRLTRKQLQPPFRQQDLLPVGRFMAYCSKHGIRTTLKELEYLDKESILIPALKVNRGVVEVKRIKMDVDGMGLGPWEWRYVEPKNVSKFKFREIDKKTYYMRGGIRYGDPGWLDYYIERGMVLYPAEQNFQPWENYIRTDTEEFTTNPKLWDQIWKPYYSKLQAYPLGFIQQTQPHIAVELKDELLEADPQKWYELGQQMVKMRRMLNIPNSTRNFVFEWYRFLKLVNSVEDLWDLKHEGEEQFLVDALKENGNDWKEARRDLKAHLPTLEAKLSIKARKLLENSEITVDDIDNWKLNLMVNGTFGSPIGMRSAVSRYLRKLSDEDLANSEDPYRLVYDLNWFTRLCGGKTRTIKSILTGRHGYKACPICNRPFEPKKKTDVTCGLPLCIRGNKNARKREARRAKS